jgi:ADP-heptose:LPS heptosyltransferase
MPAPKLLIIHQGALGDFILTFPAIARLQAHTDCIDVLCQGRLGRLAQSLGLASNAHPLEAARFASLFSHQTDARTDALLATYGDIVLFSLSGALEQSVNRLCVQPVCRIPPRPPADIRIHLAQFVLEKLARCGLIDKVDADPTNTWAPERRAAPEIPAKILLHPGAGSMRKRWLVSHFLDVATRLAADGLTPEFILGPAETDLVPALQHVNRPLHTLEDLQDLVALLQSAGGYIGNDSGASHLAAFLGLPSVVIFGPTDPVRWAPVGRRVKIVRPALQCRPCFETETTNCDTPECLEQTFPRQVIEAFYTLYREKNRGT